MFLSFVCTLLHAGSSVLQISEHQVCSLDKVPQACEWLLACLQVTLAALPAPPINSPARCSWFPPNQMEPELFSFFLFFLRNVFVLAAISNHEWFVVLWLSLTCFTCDQSGPCCVFQTLQCPPPSPLPPFFFSPPAFVTFMIILSYCGLFTKPFWSIDLEAFRPKVLKYTHTLWVPAAVQVRAPSPSYHMGWQMASNQGGIVPE